MLELAESNPYPIRAYRRAAETIPATPVSIRPRSCATPPRRDDCVDWICADVVAKQQPPYGHDPDPCPSASGAEALGVAPLVGVEYEQRPAAGSGEFLGGDEQGGSDASTAGAAVHPHLAHVGPVRLVLRLSASELDGADDSGVILGNEQGSLTGLRLVGTWRQKAPGFGRRQGV